MPLLVWPSMKETMLSISTSRSRSTRGDLKYSLLPYLIVFDSIPVLVSEIEREDLAAAGGLEDTNTGPSQDFSLKQGEKITVKIGNKTVSNHLQIVISWLFRVFCVLFLIVGLLYIFICLVLLVDAAGHSS